MGEIKGWHVFSAFVLGFGVIIAVNMTLAINAVRTFPGLEVANSYAASQSFEADRAAQMALGWEVTAEVVDSTLKLQIMQDGLAIEPLVEKAVFGRATNVGQDQDLEFIFKDGALIAPVSVGPGNWNLRFEAISGTGVAFRQRIQIRVQS